jgi:internalin A
MMSVRHPASHTEIRTVPIPFSADVAQSTPRLSESGAESTSGPAFLVTQSEDKLIAKVASVVRDRIAKALNKPVAQLSSTDLVDVETLSLSNAELLLSDLEGLSALPSLRVLNLNNSRVGDAAMVAIGRLTNLRELRISNTNVSDLGLKHIASWKSLRSLQLGTHSISDAGMAYVAKIRSLKELALFSTMVTDFGLRGLKGLQLTELVWTGTHITDEMIPVISEFPDLQNLWLDSSQVSDAGLKPVLQLPHLARLSLSNTLVTDSSIQTLSAIANLSRVWVDKTKISAAGVAQLRATRPKLDVTTES